MEEIKTSTEQWCVYFIQENSTGIFKIGHASDIQNRLKSLQLGNPRKLSLVYSESFNRKEDAIDTEAVLHDYFRMYCLSGEWFDARGQFDALIDGFKKYGSRKYLQFLIERRERFFNFNLHLKYKKLFEKMAKMVGDDIENRQIEQMEYLREELKVFGREIFERIIRKNHLIGGDGL